MLLKIFYIVTALVLVLIASLAFPIVQNGLPALLKGGMLSEGYWDFQNNSYHALAMVFGSLVVSIIALILASLIGLPAAIFLSEFLSPRPRVFFKMIVELLAGIPSIIFGLLGVTVLLPLLTPILQDFGSDSADTLFSAGLLLAIMILPSVITFSDDALRCVSSTSRKEGLGLGLTKLQVILHIVLPEAWKGIGGALSLSTGRAIGETVAVYLLIGRSDKNFVFQDLTWRHATYSGQSITSKLGGSEIAIAYGDLSHWQPLMAIALLLWIGVMSLSLPRLFLRKTPL